MATTSIQVAETPLVRLALQRADDALVLGHRLSEWCGHAPVLEEDIALANLALDLIGQARELYALAGEAEGAGHDEDQLAYLRNERAYRNLLLLEQPNGDFALTIARQFLYAAFIDPWWRATLHATHPGLAAIAAKAEKETAYHLRHSAEWLIRLGDGTPESHRRAQEALDRLWPYTGEMFEPAEATLVADGVCADPPGLRETWNATVDAVLAQATLQRPKDGWMQTGGRAGRHTEHLGPLLAELQYMQRVLPGAVW
ncbi:1,2-phenylacetyl-CoA epoxidase subunit PaaC [Limobrevibacterium gyesilva]|uniref:Phenylacetate-CoA oxygenase subunit PaaC n=1 Tax=Limobrevibacterium gyesilva TaxID=2991712 RepID=A0AA41YRH3_9PROT|nr:1,2-phenylacetyl-CoA epoxidase subunit PaaC [Limobrevibacterium gyesilva]MCW3476968.1 phenylacetate-CoA oxygenase subunit PaaC [Limobrevibacterium gyesilva]